MNRIIFKLLMVTTCCLAGCKKITNGFLSDTLRYKSPDLYCQRGLPIVQSDPINLDGSTPPIAFKMLNLRDSSGKTLPAEFNTKYDITVFKPGMSFNVDTDTTIALLNQKRETKNVTPMEFNNISGQLTFNKGSLNLPLGIYVFDIEATNVHGTKFYPSLGRINVIDPTTDDMFQLEDNSNNAFYDADANVVIPMKGLKVIFTKVSPDGARIFLKISDKNGNPFNPNAGEIIKRGDRPTFENYTKFHPISYNDTSMICDFEVPPFPLAKYVDASTDWGHLMYYRIPSQFVLIDGMAAHQYSANIRIAFDVKLEGTYIVEYRMPDAVRTP